jgi:beta-lactamase class D
MRVFARLLALATLLLAGRAQAWEERAEIAALFRQHAVTGTFVLHDPQAGTDLGHHESRARRRYSPASTFKIANSLIGVSVGAVSSVDEVLPYHATAPAFVPAWERDMSLRDAIAMSNVPIYQLLARRIGLTRMREAVQRLDYGNAATGTVVDRFWLDGPLAISAIEQTRFLARLARGELPAPVDAQRAVRDILLLDSGEGWRLYGKTGWQHAPGPGVGWWVGWVERGTQHHAFALNIDLHGDADAPKRVLIGRAALMALGLIDAR